MSQPPLDNPSSDNLDSDNLVLEYPAEFQVDTSQAADPGSTASKEPLEALLSMREALTRLVGFANQERTRSEEEAQSVQRHTRKVLQATVEVIDELRRLVQDARRNLSRPPASKAIPESTSGSSSSREADRGGGFLGWLFSGSRSPTQDEIKPEPRKSEPESPVSAQDEAQDEAQDWLGAFDRLVGLAVNKLEDLQILHVPLLGQDLKTLTFQGKRVKPWVAVKNQSEDGALVVQKEVRGLWVSKQGKEVMPVLQGEVLV